MNYRRLLIWLCLCAATAIAQEVQLESRVFDLARQLRCPVCVSESVADSGAEVAVEMRSLIQSQLQEGKSDAEVLAFFQARYGDWILLEPPKRGLHLVVWLLPAAAALFGIGLLLLLLRRWTRRSREPLIVDETELRRVREAMEGKA